MPDTFGKRQRESVKAKKAQDREERRVARLQRKEAIASGVLPPPAEDAWLGTPIGLEDLPPPPDREESDSAR
jgi:hypothetical protein